MRQPCLQCPPGSGTVGVRPGLCFRCYNRQRAEVSRGKTTWTDLESKGLALPVRTLAERFRGRQIGHGL
jgi:hypothetical protein